MEYKLSAQPNQPCTPGAECPEGWHTGTTGGHHRGPAHGSHQNFSAWQLRWTSIAGHVGDTSMCQLTHRAVAIKLLQTVEGLHTLDRQLGRAHMSAGGEHTVYIQPDRNIIPDGTYVLGEYEVIRLRIPPPDEELANRVAPRMMALQPVKDEATDCTFRYAMHMNAVTGPPGPRPVVPFTSVNPHLGPIRFVYFYRCIYL